MDSAFSVFKNNEVIFPGVLEGDIFRIFFYSPLFKKNTRLKKSIFYVIVDSTVSKIGMIV